MKNEGKKRTCYCFRLYYLCCVWPIEHGSNSQFSKQIECVCPIESQQQQTVYYVNEQRNGTEQAPRNMHSIQRYVVVI